MSKFVFVTGGVVSSIGKGIVAASLGRLLKSRGYSVSILKLDPYLNVDPGTMSPFQHGEVFVTEDGAETDLDLGHYERFTDTAMTRLNSVTTGSIYQAVINKERRGNYNGGTVQVIPHITGEIRERIHRVAANSNADIIITEIGGTVGDIESLPFLEAIREFKNDVNRNDVAYIHVTLLPYIKTSGEIKTKPTQHSVKELRSIGIQPDLLVCRSDKSINEALKKKLSGFCGVSINSVIEALELGAPPHGGIAFGLDRITMLIIGADSIRETIAFPKNQQAKCLLTNAPSNVSESQLKELDIEITIDE